VPRANHAGPESDPCLERIRFGQAQLSKIQRNLVRMGPGPAHEAVDHLGNSERGQRRVLLAAQELGNLRGRRLSAQRRDHGVRVENDHR